jgi:hypothetical protein
MVLTIKLDYYWKILPPSSTVDEKLFEKLLEFIDCLEELSEFGIKSKLDLR